MNDQVAVVTGGAQGIGLAVARLLAEQGASVASWDIDLGNAAAMSALWRGNAGDRMQYHRPRLCRGRLRPHL